MEEKTMLDYFEDAADEMGFRVDDTDRFFFTRHIQKFFEDYVEWCSTRREDARCHVERYTFLDRLYEAAERVGYELTEDDIKVFNEEQMAEVKERAQDEDMDCEEYMRYYEIEDYMHDYANDSSSYDDYCDSFVHECIDEAQLDYDDDGMVIYQ